MMDDGLSSSLHHELHHAARVDVAMQRGVGRHQLADGQQPLPARLGRTAADWGSSEVS
jgi:hypothetical protein